jgi:hypothetical protein
MWPRIFFFLLPVCALCAIIGTAAYMDELASFRNGLEQAASEASEKFANELKRWPLIRHLVEFPLPTDREF